jgi:two-component sensor histidine kinase
LFYSISNELIASLLFGPFGSLSATFAVLLNAGVFAILSTLIGLLRLTRDELQELEKELDNILGVNNFIGRMDLERARLRQRELAKIVHGRLQNQILGAVLALTKSPEKDSPEKLLQEIERLEMEVGASTEPKQSPVSASLSEEFSALTDRWRGLVNVQVTSDLALDLTPQDVSACVLVAEEAITNAVRHGLASSIDIAIVPALHNWAITITDNGVGPRNGRPSLGTLTLNQIAGESWSLVANGSGVGSILTVQIPKYQSESKIV